MATFSVTHHQRLDDVAVVQTLEATDITVDQTITLTGLGHNLNGTHIVIAVPVNLFAGVNEAGDLLYNENEIIVYTKKEVLQKVKESLESNNIKIEVAEITYIPKSEVRIDDGKVASKIIKLIDSLEESEDVTSVHANFDLAEEVLKSLD
jgi:transcriptional/translational regulatory protein YebC/TACO1